MTGLWVLLGALVVTGALGWWLRGRDGRIRAATRSGDTHTAEAVAPAAALPAPIRTALDDTPVTLVQLSTTFCAPCRHARAVLHQLAEHTDGLRHVELDVTNQPEVATGLGVPRTPTTLAYAPDGTELFRVGGVPKGAELLAALAPHLGTRSA